MNYIFDNYGRYTGTSKTAVDRSTSIKPDELTPDWNWSGLAWVYAPNIRTSSTPQDVLPSLSEGLSEEITAKINAALSADLFIERRERGLIALTYKEAGYPEEAPAIISELAESEDVTTTEAADLILTQAAAAHAAIALIDALRSKSVEIKDAPSVDSAMNLYSDTFLAITKIEEAA